MIKKIMGKSSTGTTPVGRNETSKSGGKNRYIMSKEGDNFLQMVKENF